MSKACLFSVVFAIGLVNAMIRPVRDHVNDTGFINALLDGGGISFIVWFAIYCSLDLLLKSGSEVSGKKDWIAAFSAVFLFIIPSAFVSWLVLAVFAGYCSFTSFKPETFARNAALVMLAISLRVPVSDICLKLTADIFLQFDAMATQLVAGFMNPLIGREGNIIIGSDGHELFIMTGCASFTNISLAFLLWFTLVRTQILVWKRSFTLYIVPLITLVMGINIWRLSMMALSKEDYLFYHDGVGGDIVNVAILLVALGVAFLSIYIDQHRFGRQKYVA
ncbi:MAG: hypothetical protein COB14_06815 [Alphaproteobacteria bacterium]|nr:MAG: hypothetical protein COB14_06815 [Alphaproteobacteria bacterium]